MPDKSAPSFGIGRILACLTALKRRNLICQNRRISRNICSRKSNARFEAAGTEPAGSSPLDAEYRRGTYFCVACGRPVFLSDASESGWPSFWAAIDGALGSTEEQAELEVHCRRCGGHLGHVLSDGPPPSGLRYCINGVALRFVPA